MTTEFFNVQIGRLASVFGEKAFAAQRQKLIWDWTKDLYDYEFSKIIDHMIASCKVPPMPVEFKEAAGREKRSRGRVEQEQMQYTIRCDFCFDTGVCKAEQGQFQTLAKCDCGAACDWKLKFISDARDFKKGRLEPRWFKAEDVILKAQVWREKIKIAEQYWGAR